MVEQPAVLGSGQRTPQPTPSAELALSKAGTVARSLSSPGEKSPKSNWVSESTPNSKCVCWSGSANKPSGYTSAILNLILVSISWVKSNTQSA